MTVGLAVPGGGVVLRTTDTVWTLPARLHGMQTGVCCSMTFGGGCELLLWSPTRTLDCRIWSGCECAPAAASCTVLWLIGQIWQLNTHFQVGSGKVLVVHALLDAIAAGAHSADAASCPGSTSPPARWLMLHSTYGCQASPSNPATSSVLVLLVAPHASHH